MTSRNSVFKLLIESFESLTKFIDSNCKNLQPWQIIFYTSSASLLAAYLHNFYNNVDTGTY